MITPQTMFEKIWDRHVIVARSGNECLLHIDRNFVHEGSFHAFGALARDGKVDQSVVQQALKTHNINPEKPNPAIS